MVELEHQWKERLMSIKQSLRNKRKQYVGVKSGLGEATDIHKNGKKEFPFSSEEDLVENSKLIRKPGLDYYKSLFVK